MNPNNSNQNIGNARVSCSNNKVICIFTNIQCIFFFKFNRKQTYCCNNQANSGIIFVRCKLNICKTRVNWMLCNDICKKCFKQLFVVVMCLFSALQMYCCVYWSSFRHLVGWMWWYTRTVWQLTHNILNFTLFLKNTWVK